MATTSIELTTEDYFALDLLAKAAKFGDIQTLLHEIATAQMNHGTITQQGQGYWKIRIEGTPHEHH